MQAHKGRVCNVRVKWCDADFFLKLGARGQELGEAREREKESERERERGKEREGEREDGAAAAPTSHTHLAIFGDVFSVAVIETAAAVVNVAAKHCVHALRLVAYCSGACSAVAVTFKMLQYSEEHVSLEVQ